MEGRKQYKSIAGISGSIRSWYLWLPPEITLDSLLSGEAEPMAVREERPDVRFLPARYRRKLSTVSAISLHVAYYTSRALVDTKPHSAVFASRHGEGTITVSLFEDIASNEMLSPLSFSRSVHNTASGLHSIVSDNRSPQTAIAAGEATAAMGILEASMQAQSTQEPILLVIADEALHHLFDSLVTEVAVPFGLGIILTPEGQLPDFSIDECTGCSAGIELANYLRTVYPEKELAEGVE